jgi:hypothetical protein
MQYGLPILLAQIICLIRVKLPIYIGMSRSYSYTMIIYMYYLRKKAATNINQSAVVSGLQK